MTESSSAALAQPNIALINARLPGHAGLQQIWLTPSGWIQQVIPMNAHVQTSSNCLQVLDVAGDWISLGGLDLQINGALGLAFTDLELKHKELLQQICEFLWEQGIDAFLPTLVTTSPAKIQRSLSVIANLTQPQQSAAQILGVHLEGPFLNPQKRGAHPAEYLLPLSIEQVQRILGDYVKLVKVITLAPELDPTGETISYLRSLGIIVSLGHSQATAAQATEAFDLGASMVTHAFNAMPALHHREPGLLGAALVHPNVQCGFIADGQHICPVMMQLLLRASCYEQSAFLVSDALAPLGLPDGVYPWDSRTIIVRNGTACLADGTLAGTTEPLLVGVQNLVKWKVCEVESAIALATVAPRRALSLSGLELGKSATHLLRWHLNQSTHELTWERLQLYERSR